MITRLLTALLAVWILFTAPACAAAGPTPNVAGGKNMVVLSTSLGEITIALDAEKAPITVKNFLEYVDAGFYDGTIFHRVIKGFMVQGGGFTADMQQKSTNPPIRNEADNGLKNQRGSIAMARTANKDSATAQFFINAVHNTFLDHGVRDFGYAVFGQVVSGMDVVDRIEQVRTGWQDVPSEPVIIQTIRRASAPSQAPASPAPAAPP
ncbi:MAG: peptidylprolyl isomerase [Magnetococcales bacterium]|nr:peptidylprolyl isomerase [Magnetococcales bacterium]